MERALGLASSAAKVGCLRNSAHLFACAKAEEARDKRSERRRDAVFLRSKLTAKFPANSCEFFSLLCQFVASQAQKNIPVFIIGTHFVFFQKIIAPIHSQNYSNDANNNCSYTIFPKSTDWFRNFEYFRWSLTRLWCIFAAENIEYVACSAEMKLFANSGDCDTNMFWFSINQSIIRRCHFIKKNSRKWSFISGTQKCATIKSSSLFTFGHKHSF